MKFKLFLSLVAITIFIVNSFLLFSQVKNTNSIVSHSGDLHLLSKRASWLNTTQKLEVDVANRVEKIIRDAEKMGLCLVVTSSFRSLDDQLKMKEKYGQLAEDPGKSEHHTGRAVDFTACPMSLGVRDDDAARDDLLKDFEELPEYKWLVENSYKYGIEQTYSHESWHWYFR